MNGFLLKLRFEYGILTLFPFTSKYLLQYSFGKCNRILSKKTNKQKKP